MVRGCEELELTTDDRIPFTDSRDVKVGSQLPYKLQVPLESHVFSGEGQESKTEIDRAAITLLPTESVAE